MENTIGPGSGSGSGSGSLHRRKSSQSDEENTVVTPALTSNPPLSPLPTRPAPPPPSPRSPLLPSSASSGSGISPRSRVHSTPAPPPLMGHSRTMSISVPPGSAGPYRTSFKQPPPPSPFRASISSPGLTVNGHSHGHSRTRSISTPYSPPLPSPLSVSFPVESQTQSARLVPETVDSESQKHVRRHSRLHSRNLSIFFPRPGSLPSNNTISEDGSQELEFPSSDIEAMPIPSAGSSVNFPSRRMMTTSLQNPKSAGAGREPGLGGFTFGGKHKPRPPSISGPPIPPMMGNGPSSASSASRRGHHHKHSLSHNFFSFLEPGSTSAGVEQQDQGEQEVVYHTQPTPVPLSPWNPISPFPKSAGLVSPAPQSQSLYAHFPPTPSPQTQTTTTTTTHSTSISSSNYALALPFTFLQFTLGAFLWVSGQQIGSLGTTGLGYWVVFDAFGVGINGGVFRRKGNQSKIGEELRRPYGSARLTTVLQFAQCVYLMFSSVYICKETVEHMLLSSPSTFILGGEGGEGHREGHHHHAGDENGAAGIQFPYILASIAFITLSVSAVVFDNHRSLVDVTGNRIPSPRVLLSTLSDSIYSSFTSLTSLFSLTSTYSRSSSTYDRSYPRTKLGMVLSNPYVISPLGMCVGIWWGKIGVDESNQTLYDLTLAGLITFITFRVSYSSCVVLGTVLLQTAPYRVAAENGNGSRGVGNGIVLRGGGKIGRMEVFLRAMKDIERHPQVLHLPAPHIWQFTPTPVFPGARANNNHSDLRNGTSKNVNGHTHIPLKISKTISNSSLKPNGEVSGGSQGGGGGIVESESGGEHIVATLELHVQRDLPDEDVLRLTRWAWEKCVGALTMEIGSGGGGELGGGAKADVTVGIVRG